MTHAEQVNHNHKIIKRLRALTPEQRARAHRRQAKRVRKSAQLFPLSHWAEFERRHYMVVTMVRAPSRACAWELLRTRTYAKAPGDYGIVRGFDSDEASISI